MNESTNKSKSRGRKPKPDATKSGTPNDPVDVKSKKAKKRKAPKTSASDIYGMVIQAHVVDEGLVRRLFAAIDGLEDSVPLLSKLLSDFMDSKGLKDWSKLRELNFPSQLFRKLCLDVGIPDLEDAWELKGQKDLPQLMNLLKEYVPPDDEAASRFLKERTMLPLSFLIYRGFRNESPVLGDVLCEWVRAIARGCENHRGDVLKEAQRTAKWLMDLSGKRSSPMDFLHAVAPVMLALRAGRETVLLMEELEERKEKLESNIAGRDSEIERLSRLVVAKDRSIEDQVKLLSAANEEIRKLKDKLAFGGAQAGVSEEQAVGALKERLKRAITPRTGDAKMFLDRPEPNVEAVLGLLTEIEEQFN